MSRAQDLGLQFWQTKSNAMIVYDPVPEDCIERVVCGEGDRILFERICTLRFVPKITLRSRRQAQQHHQQTTICWSSHASIWKHAPADEPDRSRGKGRKQWFPNLQALGNKCWSMMEPQIPQMETDLRTDGTISAKNDYRFDVVQI